MSVLVAGTLSFDSVETHAGCRENEPGGSALFAAFAAARTTEVRLLTVIGADFHEPTLTQLGDLGTDLGGVERAAGPTFRWRARYFEGGDRRETLATQFGVLTGWAPRLPESYRSSPRVFLANAAPDLQAMVLDQLTGPALIALDTMGSWIERDRKGLLALLPRVDALLVNEEEALLLTGVADPRQSARCLRAMGACVAVVKRGSKGAVAACAGGILALPACRVPQVVDPTGAGDVFGGALVAALTAAPGGGPELVALGEALAWASALASAVVEDFGLAGLTRLTPDEARHRRDALRRQLRCVES